MKAPPDPSADKVTGDCSDWQLRQLLRLASGPAQRTPPAVADVRRHPIAELESLTGRDGESGREIVARVLSPTATTGSLRQVKRLAKQLIEEAPPGPRREAATALYHLAIATALVRFHVNISRIPSASRRALYLSLADAFEKHPAADIFLVAAGRA